MNKDIAREINELITSYLNDEEADDINVEHDIVNIINRKAKDQMIGDRIKLIGQAIPLLFNCHAASEEDLGNYMPLQIMLGALEKTARDYVFETFIHETKIKLTSENEDDIYSFFAIKGNFEHDEYRKESLAVLIGALSKAYNAL